MTVTNNIEEKKRITRLRGYGALDTPNEPAFDKIVAEAVRAFGSPIGLISLVDEDRQWFKAKIGLEITETPKSISFCTHAIRGPEIMVVEDTERDARFASNPWVLFAPFIRFYAGAPLITPDSMRIGTVCVLDTRPHSFVSNVEKRVLKELARKTILAFEQRQPKRRQYSDAERFRRLLKTTRRSAHPGFSKDEPIELHGSHAIDF